MIECECADAGPALSVVVPVHNESGNIAPLVSEIVATLDGSIDFEIVVIDDGSSDDTLARLKDLALHEPRLHGWHHRASCGQSTDLHTGIRRARAPLVATLDGNGQNDLVDIPRLLERWRRERAMTDGALLLTGWRASRHDTWLRRASSRIANRVRSALLHDDTPDTGCGLTLFIIPRAFWYFSLAGGATLLAYSIHRGDPVFIIGQSAGLFIYLRNLWLIYREPVEETTTA